MNLLRKPRTLADIVFSHYLRSALLPVLTVELVLVVAYFSVNAWNISETVKALRLEVSQVLPHLARQEAFRLQDGFSRISREAALLSREHEAILDEPEKARVRGAEPVFAQAANGTWYQTNRSEHSSWYAPVNSPMDRRQRSEARATTELDPLYEHMVADIPNVVAAYYNSAENTNRLHPFIPKVWEQYPADIRMADYNFYYLADSAHDASGRPVWTGAYLDPAGQGWMVSCVAPVRARGRLLGVAGLDVTIEKLVKNLLGQDFPWKSSAFLVDDSGMILAMPGPVEELFGLKELKAHVYDATVKTERLKPQEFNLLANPDSRMAARFREILRTGASESNLEVRGRTVFLAQERIPETGWHLFLVARSENVFSTVMDVARRSRIVGWFVVGGMTLFYIVFFSYLRRKARRMSLAISNPITELAEATSRLGRTGSNPGQDLPMSGIPEIDALTTTFNDLARDLDQRSRELVEAGVREQLNEKEAELSFARGQFESASSYMHNVGNLTVRLGSVSMDLQRIVESAGQYPEAFQRIRSGGDPEVVDRFEKVLVERTVPRLASCARELEEVRSGIHNAIEHQQRSFLEGGDAIEPEEFDLSETVVRTCRDFGKWDRGDSVTLRTEIESGIRIRNHRHQIRDGIVNALKNAFEAIRPGIGSVEVALSFDRTSRRAVLKIRDDGHGILPKHASRVLTAGFTTKPWGHGLGLHSLAVFLAAHNGKVSLESPGPGDGATLTIEVGDA